MLVKYFAIGFLTSSILIAILFMTIFYLLKKRRNKSAQIRGYLDLIPNLSDTQRRQVHEIRQLFLPKVDAIRKDLYLKRAELANLLFEEPIERLRIDELARNILEYQEKLENEVIDHIIEEKDLLTPRQKRRFYHIIVEQFSSGGLGVHDVKGRKTEM